MFVPRKYKLFLPMIFLLCFQNLNSMRDLNKFTTMVNTDQDNYFYDKTIEKNVHFVISDDFEKCELETEIGVVVNTNQYFNNCVLKKALTLTDLIFEGKYKKLEINNSTIDNLMLNGSELNNGFIIKLDNVKTNNISAWGSEMSPCSAIIVNGVYIKGNKLNNGIYKNIDSFVAELNRVNFLEAISLDDEDKLNLFIAGCDIVYNDFELATGGDKALSQLNSLKTKAYDKLINLYVYFSLLKDRESLGLAQTFFYNALKEVLGENDLEALMDFIYNFIYSEPNKIRTVSEFVDMSDIEEYRHLTGPEFLFEETTGGPFKRTERSSSDITQDLKKSLNLFTATKIMVGVVKIYCSNDIDKKMVKSRKVAINEAVDKKQFGVFLNAFEGFQPAPKKALTITVGDKKITTDIVLTEINELFKQVRSLKSLSLGLDIFINKVIATGVFMHWFGEYELAFMWETGDQTSAMGGISCISNINPWMPFVNMLGAIYRLHSVDDGGALRAIFDLIMAYEYHKSEEVALESGEEDPEPKGLVFEKIKQDFLKNFYASILFSFFQDYSGKDIVFFADQVHQNMITDAGLFEDDLAFYENAFFGKVQEAVVRDLNEEKKRIGKKEEVARTVFATQESLLGQILNFNATNLKHVKEEIKKTKKETEAHDLMAQIRKRAAASTSEMRAEAIKKMEEEREETAAQRKEHEEEATLAKLKEDVAKLQVEYDKIMQEKSSLPRIGGKFRSQIDERSIAFKAWKRKRDKASAELKEKKDELRELTIETLDIGELIADQISALADLSDDESDDESELTGKWAEDEDEWSD